MTHPDDDEWEYNPYFGCMMKKWDPSERFKSACRQYLEFEAMTEQDDPPSAKNLENVENPTFGTVGGIDRSNNAISMKPSPYRLQPILNEDGGIDFKLEVDPGNCGIFGAETGKRDPFHWACSTLHDPHYQALLDGKDPGRTNVQTQWDFTKGILSTMAEGLYAVVTGPFYILFGAVLGGSLRFTQLQRRKAAKEGKPWPKNETED